MTMCYGLLELAFQDGGQIHLSSSLDQHSDNNNHINYMQVKGTFYSSNTKAIFDSHPKTALQKKLTVVR